MDLQPQHRVDRYEVEAILGRGGMATVYLVRHLDLDARHALKVLHVPAASIQQRLLLEGKVQSQLRHPNLVAVTDMVRVEGSPGLVMEWVVGPALDQWLQHTRLSWAQADHLARGILAGVAEAHANGLVHRDLKPANVLLAVDSDGVVPKVTDFGLAKLLTADDAPAGTRSGIAMGSPAYMSPEQIRDARRVDQRADVFALGALLYELATGVRAFGGGGDALEIFDCIRRGAFDDPRPLAPDLPESCAELIAACLSVEREDRPANAGDLLQAWVAGRPAPVAPWDSETLEDMTGLAPEPRPLSASLSDRSTGSETFSEFDLSLGSVTSPLFEDVGSSLLEAPEPAPAPSRTGLFGTAALLAALLLAVGWWATRPRVHVLGEQVAQIEAGSEAQAALERGWSALKAADLERSIDELEAATELGPLAWLALGTAYRLTGDRGAGNEALWAAADPNLSDLPGAPLASAMAEAHARKVDDPLASLLAHRESHPDDVLAALLVLEFTAPTEREPRDAALADLSRTLPDAPLSAWLDAREQLRLGDPGEARQRAEAALQTHPRHPALLTLLGRAYADEGRFEEARDTLSQALELRDSAAARQALTTSLLLLGEDERARTLVDRAMDSDRPADQRTTFAIATAHVLAGLGRVRESIGLLAQAETLAEESGWAAKFQVIGTLAIVYMNAELTEPMAETTDRLQQTLLAPEVPDGERNILVRNLTYAQGVVAARQGRLDDARTAVTRLRKAGVGPVYMEWLQREIAVQERDVDRALTLFDTSPEGCERTLLMAYTAHRAGDLDRAAALAEEGLDGACPSTGEVRQLLASGWLILAEHALAEGRPGQATDAIARYAGYWPAPDEELPMAQRAQRVRDAL